MERKYNSFRNGVVFMGWIINKNESNEHFDELVEYLSSHDIQFDELRNKKPDEVKKVFDSKLPRIENRYFSLGRGVAMAAQVKILSHSDTSFNDKFQGVWNTLQIELKEVGFSKNEISGIAEILNRIDDENSFSEFENCLKKIEDKILNEENNKLREDLRDENERIQNLVKRGNTKEAILKLEKIFKNDHEALNTLLVLSSRLYENEKSEILGIRSHEAISIEKNKINYALLTFMGNQMN